MKLAPRDLIRFNALFLQKVINLPNLNWTTLGFEKKKKKERILLNLSLYHDKFIDLDKYKHLSLIDFQI